jgi:hypothetical protein
MFYQSHRNNVAMTIQHMIELFTVELTGRWDRVDRRDSSPKTVRKSTCSICSKPVV